MQAGLQNLLARVTNDSAQAQANRDLLLLDVVQRTGQKEYHQQYEHNDLQQPEADAQRIGQGLISGTRSHWRFGWPHVSTGSGSHVGVALFGFGHH